MLINKNVRIETTSKCNGRCIMCPREKMTRPKVTMQESLFKSLVTQSKQLGATHICLSGFGEPLLDKNIDDRIRFCKSLGLKTFLITNATLLGARMSNLLLDAGLDEIRFSVHGIDSNYNIVHPGFKMEHTFSNIMDFVKINQIKYDHQCETCVSCVPMGGETAKQVVEFWVNTADNIEVWKPHNWTNGRGYRETSPNRLKTCGRPFSGPIQINADGKMVICCMDYDGKLAIGDTTAETVEHILEGPEFQRIKAAHKTGDMTGLICAECDQLNADYEPLIESSHGLCKRHFIK